MIIGTGDRSNRGGSGGSGYSHFRGANGSYRGGDRDREMRGHGNYGGSYQGRANGPHPLQQQQQQQQQQSAAASATSPAPDFDLRAESSFPPLPGLEVGHPTAASSVSTGALIITTTNMSIGSEKVRKKVVSVEAQTRTNETKITVL